MQICVIYVPVSLSETSYLSLSLDSEGELIDPLKAREPSELLTLQQDKTTYLILPAESVSIYHLKLPHLSAKKAQIAIEFALEPLMPQPLDHVHLTYTYDKANQAYTTIAIDKRYFQMLTQQLRDLNVQFDVITVDATLLKKGEACYIETRLLVNSPPYQGVIPTSFESLYESCFQNLQCFTHTPLPAPLNELMTTTLIGLPIPVWLAQKVLHNKVFNLCQGEFYHQAAHLSRVNYPLIAGTTLALWVLSYFISSGILIYQQHKQLNQLNAQLLVYYKQFFPHAAEVTSPRFRIEQLLKKTQAQQSPFWKQIQTLAKNPIEIQTLYYQNNHTQIALSMKQFSDLEAYKNQLRRSGLLVKQTQARKQEKHIEATLELKS